MRPRETVVDVRYDSLQVRLAQTADEIDAAQALRYRVFYEEMGAQPTPDMAAARRDFDRFDADCDHLLVIAAVLAVPYVADSGEPLIRFAGHYPALRHG